MKKSADLDLIRDRTDIADIVREYVPSLKKAGRSYKARCPFHDEKSPSFSVDSQKGLFYCFGCQAGGDVFDFVMKIENLSFTEAVHKLAKKAGVDWHPTNVSPAGDKLRIDIKKALEFASNYYHKFLMASPQAKGAREYLKSRNIGKTTAEKFQIGFAPDGFENFRKTAVKAGYNEEILIKAGLLGTNEKGTFDYFRKRIMFPIANASSEIVGFGGRILDKGEPKYLNSPETPVFHKGRVLFGLNNASSTIRKDKEALFLEGYTDVIACHKAGIENGVAPLGTAVGFDHARLLKRYAEQVTILFDGDFAGINAAVKAGRILTEGGLYVKMATLPEGLDPDDYIDKHGKEKLLQIIKSAKDILTFHIETLLKDKNMPLTAKDKSTTADILAQTISVQADQIIAQEWIKQVSEKLQIDHWALNDRINKIKYRFGGQTEPEQKIRENAYISPSEFVLLSSILKFPQHIGLCSQLEEEDFANKINWNIFCAIKGYAEKNITSEKITGKLIDKFITEKNLITKLSMYKMPENFNPEIDIKHLVKNIKRASITARLKKIKEQKKALEAQEKSTLDLQKEEMRLSNILKSSAKA